MNNKKDLTVKEAFALAIQNHQNNNLQDAQNYYQKVLELDPNYVHAHNNIGLIFKELGENQKAKDCFEKTIEIDPSYANAHNNIGLIFIELGENQKAKNCFEKAIEINPDYTDALNNLGALLQELRKYEKAINSYEKVIAVDPSYTASYYNLGNIFFELKEYQKAISYNEKAIEIKPDYTDAHITLGNIFTELKEYQKAIISYGKAIQIDASNISTINGLSLLIPALEIDLTLKDNNEHLKKLLLFIFRKNNINPLLLIGKTKLLLISKNDQSDLVKVFDSESSLLANNFIKNLLKDELFHLMVQKSILTDPFLEKLLTKLRSEIFFSLNNHNQNFLISLAEQCWLNEYVYIQSEKESKQIDKLQKKIEKNKEINELEIAIVGCYIPLNSSKIITNKLLNYKSTNILFNDLINLQIKEPLSEKELVKSIITLDKISDSVSKKVQEQYEEHPYPRWRFINDNIKFDFLSRLNQNIDPNYVKYNNKFDNPNVLIAGCGTGSHPISSSVYKNANILAVDLSLTSLAYAKRKTEELNIKNIEFLHADILNLKNLNRKFDIIESSGVIHHMKDPVAGLEVLVDILEPHGFLRLCIYSEAARQDIIKAREFIKNKNYKNTSTDIKICRQNIVNEKEDMLLQKVSNRKDFYSTSGVKDLLFHVQEHRFTIPQISVILKDLNLEFLGFFFSDPLVKKKFSESFPEDKNNVSLDNWHQFEINNPDIFISMYQFWVKKK